VLLKLKEQNSQAEPRRSTDGVNVNINHVVAQKLAHFCTRYGFRQNIDRFSNFFHCQNQEKICNNTITKGPSPHINCVAILPCEMSKSYSNS